MMVAEVFGFAWDDWGPSNPKFLTREEVMGKPCLLVGGSRYGYGSKLKTWGTTDGSVYFTVVY